MENIEGFVDEIEIYSGNQLKRKDDLLTLIKLGFSGDKKELIEELSFTAKYVQGLFRVLERTAGNPDIHNTGRIKADLSDNLEKVKEKIDQIIIFADDPVKIYFRETYLQLSQTGLFNLTELLHDLEWTKKYLNQVKRTNPN
jgi:hypothetical protein